MRTNHEIKERGENGIGDRIVGILECLDEAGNVIIGPIKNAPLSSNPHATISIMLGQLLMYGTRRQKIIAHLIDIPLTLIENIIIIVFMPNCKTVISHCLNAAMCFPKDLPKSG